MFTPIQQAKTGMPTDMYLTVIPLAKRHSIPNTCYTAKNKIFKRN